VPQPINEPNKTYAPGSPERAELKERLKTMASERLDIPLVIGGREVRTGRTAHSVMPHDHKHVLADYHLAGPQEVQQAIAAAAEARREWGSWSWEDRAAVMLRAAELLATSWRATLNAATMLGQSKTVFQAEIDAASEMIDFWRFNTSFAQELYSEQPVSGPGVWNQMEYRRQPDDGAGADGQHRHLETGVERDPERLLHAEGAGGRRHAARRHQFHPRRRA
jgi:1-pyrroline-5-carboxylate dehydrogenase